MLYASPPKANYSAQNHAATDGVAMDENTRAERVWLVKDYMHRINEPDSDCPPLVDLRLSLLTACLHDVLPGSTWETVRQDRGRVVKGEGFSISPELGSRPLEWLGLNVEAALEMFMPEHPPRRLARRHR